MAEQTIELTAGNYGVSLGSIFRGWFVSTGNRIEIFAALRGSQRRWLQGVYVDQNGRLTLAIADAVSGSQNTRADLSNLFENEGSIVFAIGANSVTIALEGTDTAEPYSFLDPEIAALWAASPAADSSISGRLTLRDFVAVAPAFADDTGDAISGTVGTAIPNVTIPRATGTPAPTYSSEGDTPAGVTINLPTESADGSLVFDEDAIEAGSGTIRIRATNSVDTADWTVAYTFALPDAVAPTAAVTSPAEIDERVSLVQFATVAVSDGLYDTIAYAWSDGGAGGQVGSSGTNLFYDPPDVSVLTSVTLSCLVTVNGTGTNAKSGTSATVTATRTIMVQPETANEQVFALPGSTHTESSLTHRWEFPLGERPPLINALKANDSDSRFLAGIVIGNNNFVELLFAASQTEDAATRNDLADTFETDGAFTLVADNRTLALDLDSQDLTEPYRWQPSPTTPVSSFRTGVGSGDGVAGVLTLDTGIRPDAVAPDVTIGAVTEVDEDGTLALSASVSGGTYDSIAYAWAVDSGGGTIAGTGASVTYNPAGHSLRYGGDGQLHRDGHG